MKKFYGTRDDLRAYMETLPSAPSKKSWSYCGADPFLPNTNADVTPIEWNVWLSDYPDMGF